MGKISRFKGFSSGLKSYAEKSIAALPDFEKQRLRGWINAVKEIKKSEATAVEKNRQVSSLNAPNLILDLIKAHTASFIESKTPASREAAHTVMEGAEAIISTGSIIGAKVVRFGMRKWLSKVVLSPNSDELLTYLEQLAS